MLIKEHAVLNGYPPTLGTKYPGRSYGQFGRIPRYPFNGGHPSNTRIPRETAAYPSARGPNIRRVRSATRARDGYKEAG